MTELAKILEQWYGAKVVIASEEFIIIRMPGGGAVTMLFPGEFTYITENPVDKKHWTNPGTDVKFDDKGRAIIKTKFNGPGAKIVFFGVD